MKKFFAILAAICLFTAVNVFADSWTGNGSGQFNAGIVCTPSWDVSVQNASLGNYFEGHTDVTIPGTHTCTAVLDGPGGADYTFHMKPGATQTMVDYGSVNGTAISTATLESAFGAQYQIWDDAGTSYIKGDWTVTMDHSGAFGCENNDNKVTFLWTAKTITTASGASGTLYFNVTANVTVSI